MKLDLAAARRQQAQLQRNFYRENPPVREVSSRLAFVKPKDNEGPEQDPESKYITERPYLPQNRRTQRWAAN